MTTELDKGVVLFYKPQVVITFRSGKVNPIAIYLHRTTLEISQDVNCIYIPLSDITEVMGAIAGAAQEVTKE